MVILYFDVAPFLFCRTRVHSIYSVAWFAYSLPKGYFPDVPFVRTCKGEFTSRLIRQIRRLWSSQGYLNLHELDASPIAPLSSPQMFGHQ